MPTIFKHNGSAHFRSWTRRNCDGHADSHSGERFSGAGKQERPPQNVQRAIFLAWKQREESTLDSDSRLHGAHGEEVMGLSFNVSFWTLV